VVDQFVSLVNPERMIPAFITGLKRTPPSHLRDLVG